MAELAKKLYFKKNGLEQTAKAYSTIVEAGTEYIPNKIDGINCYIPIGATTDSRMTIGRVTKNGSKAILNSGKPPYDKIEWRTPGTYTFTVPAGVTTLAVTVAGAGGGGAGGEWLPPEGDAPDGTTTGCNGGRGGLVIKTIQATGTIMIKVGAGGAGDLSNGRSGGSSEVTGFVNALGGGGAFSDQTPGTSYGEGGIGGYGADFAIPGGNGSNGWVIIEYGGDI